jgi:hypothetical protein
MSQVSPRPFISSLSLSLGSSGSIMCSLQSAGKELKIRILSDFSASCKLPIPFFILWINILQLCVKPIFVHTSKSANDLCEFGILDSINSGFEWLLWRLGYVLSSWSVGFWFSWHARGALMMSSHAEIQFFSLFFCSSMCSTGHVLGHVIQPNVADRNFESCAIWLRTLRKFD